MVWGTLALRKPKGRIGARDSMLCSYPFNEFEASKINAYTPENPIHVLDHPSSLRLILQQLDQIFGQFVTIGENKIILRGKLDYKSEVEDPKTGEKQIVFTVSDPKSLYQQDSDSLPLNIVVSKKLNLSSGIYAQITAPLNRYQDKYTFFVEPQDIEQLDIAHRLPVSDWDYAKLVHAFQKIYGFNLTDTGQSWKRIQNLTNVDFLMMPKIAGENSHNQVRGGVVLNAIKTQHDQGLYELEAIDNFLDTISIKPKSSTVFNQSLIRTGGPDQFQSVITKDNRDLGTTNFKNLFTCNAGFSFNKGLHSENEKVAEILESSLTRTCIDFLNPVGSIMTPPHSHIRSRLKKDNQLVYSTQILLLEAQLLPTITRVGDIRLAAPEHVRTAGILKKFEKQIYQIGIGNETRPIKLDEESIEDAKRFLKENRENIIDFIKN